MHLDYSNKSFFFKGQEQKERKHKRREERGKRKEGGKRRREKGRGRKKEGRKWKRRKDRHGFRIRLTWVHILAALLKKFMTTDKLLNLLTSVAREYHLCYENKGIK